MEKIIERFEKITKKEKLDYNSFIFNLSFDSLENSIKLKLLKKLIESEDFEKTMVEMYFEELLLNIEFESIKKEISDIHLKKYRE